ncbi:MAG: hypothetical protein KatS3mg130_1562 [Candidatus Sumerlaea sp.]|nr:MAG: hypothetical protein KatS3mg130_1562 [Candidatus Sumerlaea sp.]
MSAESCTDHEYKPLPLRWGDALAVVLLERRGFNAEDFALRHPSGTLGKRLLLKVADLIKPDRNPNDISGCTI